MNYSGEINITQGTQDNEEAHLSYTLKINQV